MYRNKFRYEISDSGQIIRDWSTEDLEVSMRQEKSGEILIREQIEWTTDQMRKYLHGPCTKFIIECLKEKGLVMTTNGVHEFLRTEFLPKTAKAVGGKNMILTVSSESIGRKQYIKWINDIDSWCIQSFGIGLPPAEKVE
jgi:hypothetical protein